MSSVSERLRGRSELGVCVLLAVLGVLVLIDASRIPTDFTQRGPVGPAAVPVVVGVALLVIAVLLARDVLRGGHGESEMGEDVDLSHPSDWRTVLLLIAAFLANVVLIDRVGFPISGAVLFWGQGRTRAREIGGAILLDHISHFEWWAGHKGWSRGKVSSGLGVACRACGVTWS